MADRKRSKPEERSFAQMASDLDEQLTEIARMELRDQLIPPDWYKVDKLAPVKPKKTKLNLPLDEDMVAWFRGLGRGYQPRMNAVLRAYMHAVIAKEIARVGDRDWKGDVI